MLTSRSSPGTTRLKNYSLSNLRQFPEILEFRPRRLFGALLLLGLGLELLLLGLLVGEAPGEALLLALLGPRARGAK